MQKLPCTVLWRNTTLFLHWICINMSTTSFRRIIAVSSLIAIAIMCFVYFQHTWNMVSDYMQLTWSMIHLPYGLVTFSLLNLFCPMHCDGIFFWHAVLLSFLNYVGAALLSFHSLLLKVFPCSLLAHGIMFSKLFWHTVLFKNTLFKLFWKFVFILSIALYVCLCH